MATTPTTSSISRPIARLDWVVALAAAGLGLVFVGGLLRWSRYGFDVTDEGFYVNWIATPSIFKASLTQFGFVYHPLYRLVGGSLTGLRQANLVITLLLAWIFCAGLVRRYLWAEERSAKGRSASIAAVAFVLSVPSTLSLVYFYWWLPTPSYNGLAFQALLLAGTALMAAEPDRPRSCTAAGTILGLAGWLAFMAKPTTAATLGVVCVAYLLLAGRLTWRLTLAAALTAVFLLCVSALAIDGSVPTFVWRLAAGVKDDRLLAGGHSLGGAFRLDPIRLTPTEKTGFWVLAAIATVIATAGGRRRTRVAWGTLALGTVIAGGIVWLGGWRSGLPAVPFVGLQLWGVVLGSLAGSLLGFRGRFFGGLSRDRAAAAVCLALLPHVYAFGTNGNYWATGASAGLFWLAACVPLVTLSRETAPNWRAVLSLALVAQSVVIALVHVAIDHPYRQAHSLRLDDSSVDLPHGDHLFVSSSSARYLQRLQGLTRAGGFVEGTPIIDLTGHMPGALYALGAKPIGQAWMLGGYPGSGAFVAAALDRVPCDHIGRAWVLAEPSGPRAISADLLRGYGIDIPGDLRLVGELESPAEDYPTASTQQLFKPAREPKTAQLACRGLRARDVVELKDYVTR